MMKIAQAGFATKGFAFSVRLCDVFQVHARVVGGETLVFGGA